MNHFRRRRMGTVGMLVLAGFLLAGLVISSAGPAAAAKTSSVAYHDEWRELWEDHIVWTRIVIMGILDDLPGTNVYVGRLLQNVADMENALRPYYGDDADVLGNLIEDHLLIAAELLTAARNGDAAAFEDARVRWYENAEANAVQMNQMNPRFWSLEESRHMWIEHLDATLLEATTHLGGDFDGEVAAYDRIHELALEMADFMSAAVIRQVPQQFNGGAPH